MSLSLCVQIQGGKTKSEKRQAMLEPREVSRTEVRTEARVERRGIVHIIITSLCVQSGCGYVGVHECSSLRAVAYAWSSDDSLGYWSSSSPLFEMVFLLFSIVIPEWLACELPGAPVSSSHLVLGALGSQCWCCVCSCSSWGFPMDPSL